MPKFKNNTTKQLVSQLITQEKLSLKESSKIIGCNKEYLRVLCKNWNIIIPNETLKINNKHPHWKGYKEIGQAYWTELINKAKKRKIIFNITIEYAWDIFIKQDRKCAISGIKLSYAAYKDKTASLDRVDSSKGYIKGNVQWVHKDINQMKWIFPQEKLIRWCHIISDFNRST